MVLQLVNTNGPRREAGGRAARRPGLNIDDLDITPRQIVIRVP